jgi:hypothetical protein
LTPVIGRHTLNVDPVTALHEKLQAPIVMSPPGLHVSLVLAPEHTC